MLTVSVKVTEDAPAGMVTEDGTAATDVLADVRETAKPPVGAGPLIVTVPVDLPPTLIVLGLNDREERASGPTVRFALNVAEPRVAEMLVVALALSAWPVAVNVAVEDPAGTVTVPGTVATDVLELARVTVVPPVGATPLNVTVPVDVASERIEVGLRETPVRAGALTVSVAFTDVAPTVAVIWAVD